MKNLTINQGDSCYITVIKEDAEGNKINFEETDVVKMSVKRNLNQKDYDIQSADATLKDGEMIIELTPEQTNIRTGDYYYDIEYVDGNLDKYTLVKGTLTIDWDVTD